MFKRYTSKEEILEDAIKAVREIEAKDNSKPFKKVEIYYTNYIAYNRQNLAKAGIFFEGVQECLAKGEKFSPEFCEALSVGYKEYEPCDEFVEGRTNKKSCVLL